MIMGAHKITRYVWPGIEIASEEDAQKYRRKHGNEFGKEEATAIIDLKRPMLVFRPEERPTIQLSRAMVCPVRAWIHSCPSGRRTGIPVIKLPDILYE